jgi:hypothetical protein
MLFGSEEIGEKMELGWRSPWCVTLMEGLSRLAVLILRGLN